MGPLFYLFFFFHCALDVEIRGIFFFIFTLFFTCIHLIQIYRLCTFTSFYLHLHVCLSICIYIFTFTSFILKCLLSTFVKLYGQTQKHCFIKQKKIPCFRLDSDFSFQPRRQQIDRQTTERTDTRRESRTEIEKKTDVDVYIFFAR